MRSIFISPSICRYFGNKFFFCFLFFFYIRNRFWPVVCEDVFFSKFKHKKHQHESAGIVFIVNNQKQTEVFHAQMVAAVALLHLWWIINHQVQNTKCILYTLSLSLFLSYKPLDFITTDILSWIPTA